MMAGYTGAQKWRWWNGESQDVIWGWKQHGLNMREKGDCGVEDTLKFPGISNSGGVGPAIDGGKTYLGTP